LVGDELMPQAVALSQMQFQVTGILGPALAGVLIAATGSPGWAYVVDLVSYAAMLIAAVAMSHCRHWSVTMLPASVGRRWSRDSATSHHRLIHRRS
jgi:MFS family permease